VPDVFLSYSRDDPAIARRFAEGLEREGFSVWWDATLIPGEAFDQIIEKALSEAKAVVVLWSKKSVASRWVRAEATQANENKTLVPVIIEPCKRPIIFELTHTADLSHWKGDSQDPVWQAFVANVRKYVGTDRRSNLLPTPARAAVRNRVGWWAGGAAAIVIAAAGAFWFFHARPVGTAATSSAVASAQPSIAVLPFKDFSPGKDQEYFADGITEEILNTLASVPNLKVTARTSAFAFKGKDTDLRTIGATLGVRHILEGSVRKDGSQLRITAQLIDTQTDAHLWSRTYDRTLQDVFQIQQDIARAVTEELQVTLGVGLGQQPGMTRNADAFDAFLAAATEFQQFTPDARRHSIALAQKAVGLDPAYVAAWTLLGQAYESMPTMGGEPSEHWPQKAESAWQHVQQLQPDWPELQFRIADRSIDQGRWQEAAEHYRIAWAAATKFGQNTRGNDGRHPGLLVETGHTREAIAVLERAREFDPLSPAPSVWLISAYSDAGNFKAAYAEVERANHLFASPLINGGSLKAALGARDRVQVMRRIAPTNPLSALLDKPAEARAYLHSLAPSLTATGLTQNAIFFAYFGDAQGALESLRTASSQGARAFAALNLWSPVMHDMRQLPGFKQLVRDMGLVDYWRQAGWPDRCHPTTGEDFDCE
jgi:TolB-like protein/tetratricopeptide (TPR) repeat protein